jgi:hypothetical protein
MATVVLNGAPMSEALTGEDLNSVMRRAVDEPVKR